MSMRMQCFVGGCEILINTFLHEAFVVMSLEYFILDYVLSFREHEMIMTTEQIGVNMLRK